MRTAHASAIALIGLSGYAIDVQVQMASGLPALHLVGLPDTAVKEARHRVRAALHSIGVALGDMRSTINLAPARLPKTGSGFDLAIAAALLVARCGGNICVNSAFVGELGLDGEVVSVPGILPMVKTARACGFQTIYVPAANLVEAELISGIEVKPVSHLRDLADAFGISEFGNENKPEQQATEASVRSKILAQTQQPTLQRQTEKKVAIDLSDVIGQEDAKLALEVAAAGGHHWFMSGSPGAGKTMLARRLPTILPKLDEESAMEVAAIRSISGAAICHLDYEPPFEAPHHGISFSGLIGGGSKVARPGAVTRAHTGVLFLDEVPEFSPHVLDGMRQVIETGTVNIERSLAVTSYPARFQLIMAANPCPCGRFGARGGGCECTPLQIRRYRQRLSGPLLDRVDITTTVTAPTSGSLAVAKKGEGSAAVRARVSAARAAASARWAEYGFSLNVDIPSQILRTKYWQSDTEAKILQPLLESGKLSLRGADKVRRVAWSLADLAGSTHPSSIDLEMALELRTGGGSWN